MAKAKTLITSPYPTAEDIAQIFGMPMSRIRQLEREAKQIVAENDALAARKRSARKRSTSPFKKAR